jgi:miniconductance mechanosensitive channel
MKQLSDYILSASNNQGYMIWIWILAISFITYLITRYVILRAISNLFRKTSTDLDDILIDKGLFNRLSYIVPLLIIYNLIALLPEYIIVGRLVLASISVLILASLDSLISSINEIYSKSKYSNRLNIKSYLQILKLIINLFGIIIIVAVLSGKSPLYLLSGIGALTAVLMLVFKDTILSFVSSIQISSNDLFKIGDWVEAPQFGADGDVIDIALHTVKIQNWDKTISVIPTHKLIDSSFKNWRGMSESGGRRVKRSINIDMNSIKFCTDEMIGRYRKFDLIKQYIENKISDIDKHNTTKNIMDETLVNGRALTNIGTFREYISAYLSNHPKIHKDMTFLIRQLAPTENGVPIQIYIFINDTNWVSYESIQSDIFDHLLAISQEFDLRVFQNPTGNDFRKIN